MAATTKHFTVTNAVYVDISEGAESCGFRLRRNDLIRLVLAAALPPATSVNYDTYVGSGPLDDRPPVQFNELATTDRVYVRAESSPVDLVAYRR